MGLLNSNQVLKGARTPAGDRTYTQAHVREVPVYNQPSANTVAFTGGVIEVEGKNVSLNGYSFSLASVASLVTPGQQYTLAVVPAYDTPLTRAAAEAAGLNYYIENNYEGETVAYSFIPTAVEQAVLNKGGLHALSQRVYLGSADASDISIFNAYSEAAQRLIDPRYAVFPLPCKEAVEFVLAEIAPQDNASKANALLSKTKAEFDLLRSQLPQYYTERRVMNATDSAARYANRLHLIASAKSYANQTDAINDVNGTTITVNATSVFTGTNFYAVTEYTYPSNTPLGQVGNQPRVLRFLTKKEVGTLGRINPIYLYNEMTVRAAKGPASRLTLYADPSSLLNFRVDGTAASPTMTILGANYDLI